MTLPQPEVYKFKGDPIKYGTLIMAFRARIESRTYNAADCLYYLEQHLEGELRELIGGCLHTSPTHLQARWRDRAVKLKEKGTIASFKDLAEFVTSAAESANDPVFGV